MSSSGSEGLHLLLILHSMNEVTREASVTLFPLRDGVMELAVSMFWGILSEVCMCPPETAQPQTEYSNANKVSQHTKRLHISYKRCVESGHNPHSVQSPYTVMFCLSRAVCMSLEWYRPGTMRNSHTNTHLNTLGGVVFLSLWVMVGMMCESKMKFLTSFHVCAYLVQFDVVLVI